jgi:hypothetical protein
MSDDRKAEEGFFERGAEPAAPSSSKGGAAPAEPPLPSRPARPPRRDPFARSPAFALMAVVAAGWLLTWLWPDLSYYFSSRAPVDLGGPGAYRLEAAPENRLVQLRGPLEKKEFVQLRPSGGTRSIGRLAGMPVLVDHPGLAVPPVYEGRLLPSSMLEDYRPIADSYQLGKDFRVVRDGDRPRRGAWPVVGAALLLVVLLVNLRALVRGLLPPASSKERR